MIFIHIICGASIFLLFFANRQKEKEINRLIENNKKESMLFDEELSQIAAFIKKDNSSLVKSASLCRHSCQQLLDEISIYKKNEQQAYVTLQTRYQKLLRSYLLYRKKSEIEAIKEIDEAIFNDYEQLGSIGILQNDYISSAMADYYTSEIQRVETELKNQRQTYRSDKIADVRIEAERLIARAKRVAYSYEYAYTQLLKEFPEEEQKYLVYKYGVLLDDDVLDITFKDSAAVGSSEKAQLKRRCAELEEQIKDLLKFRDRKWPLLKESIVEYQKEYSSNLSSIPYMSRIIADIMTIDIDRLAWALSWGNNQERQKKVVSLNALKKEKSEEIERIKGAEYQLAYLLELYPCLQDVIETDYQDLEINYQKITDFDPVRKYIDREAWNGLSETERNQLALDRYVESRKKTNWQVGRDFELYCGYCYEKKGYVVDYYGSNNGLEDLGRDLIISNGDDVRIVQCKYWSKGKQIHEVDCKMKLDT